MSDEQNNDLEAETVESTESAPEETTSAESVDTTAAASDESAQVEAEEETPAAEAKPARKPRARKPKAEAAEDDSEANGEEPVAETPVDVEAEAETDEVVEAEDEVVEATEKPKRTRSRSRARKAEEPVKAEKPSRRRHEPEQPVAAPVVRAQAKYVRSSARKARLVCDNIRGKSVEDARAILAHTPRAVARDWSKLLESAVANAEHNHELVGEDLVIKAVTADEGPTIKRFRPRAQGRATKIRKRTAHLTILLTPKN